MSARIKALALLLVLIVARVFASENPITRIVVSERKSGFPVYCPIPLPQGKYFDTASFQIRSGAEILPSYLRILDRWEDKSIRWLGAEFVLADTDELYFVADATPVSFNKNEVKESAGSIEVSNHFLTVTIGPKGITSIRKEGREYLNAESAAIGFDSTRHFSSLEGVGQILKVVSNNPVYTEIQVRTENHKFRFDCFYRIYTGLPYLQKKTRIINFNFSEKNATLLQPLRLHLNPELYPTALFYTKSRQAFSPQDDHSYYYYLDTPNPEHWSFFDFAGEKLSFSLSSYDSGVTENPYKGEDEINPPPQFFEVRSQDDSYGLAVLSDLRWNGKDANFYLERRSDAIELALAALGSEHREHLKVLAPDSVFWKSGSGKTFISYIYPHARLSDEALIAFAKTVLAPPLAIADPDYTNECEPFLNYGKQPAYMRDLLQKLTTHTANCIYTIAEYQNYPPGRYYGKKYKMGLFMRGAKPFGGDIVCTIGFFHQWYPMAMLLGDFHAIRKYTDFAYHFADVSLCKGGREDEADSNFYHGDVFDNSWTDYTNRPGLLYAYIMTGDDYFEELWKMGLDWQTKFFRNLPASQFQYTYSDRTCGFNCSNLIFGYQHFGDAKYLNLATYIGRFYQHLVFPDGYFRGRAKPIESENPIFDGTSLRMGTGEFMISGAWGVSMALDGLVTLGKVTRDERLLRNLYKCGDWFVVNQRPDGSYTMMLETTTKSVHYTLQIKNQLLRLYELTGDERFFRAAIQSWVWSENLFRKSCRNKRLEGSFAWPNQSYAQVEYCEYLENSGDEAALASDGYDRYASAYAMEFVNRLSYLAQRNHLPIIKELDFIKNVNYITSGITELDTLTQQLIAFTATSPYPNQSRRRMEIVNLLPDRRYRIENRDKFDKQSVEVLEVTTDAQGTLATVIDLTGCRVFRISLMT